MLIFLKGPLGYETALRLYNENTARVKKQFPEFFIRRFLDMGQKEREAAVEKIPGDVYIKEVLSGGLYGCLWALCEEKLSGCHVDMEKVPLRQEVIEILELFDESPYEVSSSGCFLLLSEGIIRGADLIGYTDGSRDRAVYFPGHKRFLTPPGRQAADIKDRKGA